jgi:NTP pyrophosphatase (non-canonical NTP hydrolase)
MSKIKQTQLDHAAWTEHNFGTRPSHIDDQYIDQIMQILSIAGQTANIVLKADQNIKAGILNLSSLNLARHEMMTRFDKINDIPRDEQMKPITMQRSAAQAIIGAQEEIGELAHAFQANNRPACVDAVADICIYLLHFCNVAGIDFEDAIVHTTSQVHMRDWVCFPKNGRTE